MQQPLAIVGAGPVGLTLALLLHKQGIAVSIYEAVEEIKPLGVGINLLPHSVRVLYGLGLGPKLDDIAIRTSTLAYYNKFGQPIWSEPRGLSAGYQFPQYSIHRGQLQLMLLDEVKQVIGAGCIFNGHRLTGWRDTETGVEIDFNLAGGDSKTVAAPCLIAADGINSTARQLLYPHEGHPIYGGRVLWRGVTVAEPFLDHHTMFMAGFQDCKFVAYPISNHWGDDNKTLINWIAELGQPNWKKENQDWNKEVATEVFASAFTQWNFGWIDIPSIIEQCEHVFEFPLADRDPLPRWSFGNMTLIGDAAHPMYPIGSNGASQGILDAEKLAEEILRHTTLSEAFQTYEAERRPATAQIVLLNRKNGPEQVMQIAEERAPNGFGHVSEVISQAELEEIAAKYKQTAGFSIEAVNSKASSQFNENVDLPPVASNQAE